MITKEMTSGAPSTSQACDVSVSRTLTTPTVRPPAYHARFCHCKPRCEYCGHSESAHDAAGNCAECAKLGMNPACADGDELPPFVLPNIVSVLERDQTWWEPAEYGDYCEECGGER